MDRNDASNGSDLGKTGANSHYISANSTPSDSVLPPIINSYYEESGSESWLFSSHDIPILIGAAAGAIGLIVIFLIAALIWHCCQFALQREKSSYSLDNESQKNSVSSRDSKLYINNPIDSSITLDEKSVDRENSDQNLKRSISAPIHKNNCQSAAAQTNTQTPVIKANKCYTNGNRIAFDSSYVNNIDTNLSQNHDSMSVGMELNSTQNDKNEVNSHRSQLYITNHSLNGDFNSLKSRSLPWSQSNKRRPLTEDDESEELDSKINFSKKRKNRMRNDSAAAIAMNRSGTDPNNKIAHKDTDTLVDNEAIVVYDERTAL